MPSEEEIVMYIVLRTDLGMGKSKLAAHAAHAAHRVLRTRELSDPAATGFDTTKKWLEDWEAGSYAKVVLRADNLEEMRQLTSDLSAVRVTYAIIIDEGRTQIPAGSITAVGIQPMPKQLLAPIVGHLKLL